MLLSHMNVNIRGLTICISMMKVGELALQFHCELLGQITPCCREKDTEEGV